MEPWIEYQNYLNGYPVNAEEDRGPQEVDETSLALPATSAPVGETATPPVAKRKTSGSSKKRGTVAAGPENPVEWKLITINFPVKDYILLRCAASLSGKSVSELFRTWAREFVSGYSEQLKDIFKDV